MVLEFPIWPVVDWSGLHLLVETGVGKGKLNLNFPTPTDVRVDKCGCPPHPHPTKQKECLTPLFSVPPCVLVFFDGGFKVVVVSRPWSLSYARGGGLTIGSRARQFGARAPTGNHPPLRE